MSEPMIEGVGLNLTGLAPGRLDLIPAILAEHKRIGCTHIELSGRRLDLIVGGRAHWSRVEAVGQMVADAGLRPVLHAPHGINLMDPAADAGLHYQTACASIEVCARLNCSSMVIHSGIVPADLWPGHAARLLAAERDDLQRLGDLAGHAGVRLAVENMIARPGMAHMAYGARPAALAEQVTAVGHDWVGVCLDFGHAWLSAATLGFDWQAELQALAPLVWHLHLHDNCGRPREARDDGDAAALGYGDMHAPMYMGTIPWGALLPHMRFRPRTFAGIELGARWAPEAETVVATAHAMAAHLNTGAALSNPYQEAAE